jgi:SH3 domain-containing YSC84-like protein 1
VGCNLSAETDYKLSAEIYSYSTTKGLVAGINLACIKWEVGAKANGGVFGLAPASRVDDPGYTDVLPGAVLMW